MRRSEHGFTLLEVLIALTILGVALTVLFAIFGNSLSRSRETQSRLEAHALAASLLAQVQNAPRLPFGEKSGRMRSGLDWSVDVRRYGNDEDVQAWPAAAARVTATVRWGGKGPGQTLSLSTLKLLPKERAP